MRRALPYWPLNKGEIARSMNVSSPAHGSSAQPPLSRIGWPSACNTVCRNVWFGQPSHSAVPPTWLSMPSFQKFVNGWKYSAGS
ncbi:hypothetical protein [Kibdelosporangium phytohabitans]|uniref:Uncharacterized protein n=1 Tax=Kibdelosporangium phytohabitans TaxID=860235 RepID=A0A0N9HXH7_9PSEU|nr:hypothetical protein [Kibdelosporangium phytohabitans]ALG07942.1 hypothetical protein AOZ06_14355 [Kibdelosporangium phytohabitans]MBE1471118.1 hypothetical protein [Kibdelosporangium phytohabitans]